MKRRMIIMLAATLGVFGVVFAMQWFSQWMMNQYLDEMPEPPATISSGQVEKMNWDRRLRSVGSLVAVKGADIATEVDGTVTEVHFESGQRVEAGEPLVNLNAAVEKAELVRLEAQATLADLNRRRQEALLERGTLSRAEYDAAAAETEAARAAAAAQQGRLDQKRIRAPFDGQLGARQITVGQHLGVGSVIVTLQSLDPIDIDFYLPERHLSRIEPGLQVSVQVDAWPDQRFEGEVLVVEPRVESGTRNVMLRARLSNPDMRLRPGQSGKVQLVLRAEREVMAVPRTAIQSNPYGKAVFVIREREDSGEDEAELEVEQRFIETGEARGDYVAVLDGLEEGEEIATSGLLQLSNGKPVKINNAVKPEPKLDPRPPEG